ncbi:hybrid sensor histidine kinase/response regulator [Chthonobacter albigriseus]|uniref:hybrid sensor histidine kinase/response regulator n=1 Tax=Chthonobacter albigriseus TaxID=1683161 RepID=UPI0015EF9E54|nr:PAS domain S-box protein [Chthonobacter albigriseus]
MLFSQIVEFVPVAIWFTDPAGQCTYLNSRWFDVTGQPPDEALGSGWLRATHPDDRSAAERIFLEANARQEPFQIEYRLRRFDGVYRWSIDAANPRFAENGEFLGYVGTVIDIHDRRAAEERLRASEERLRLATEHAEVGFWDVDEINGILHWPPILKGMFGIPADETVSMADFYAGLHPDERDAVAAAYKAASDPRQRALYDVEYRTIGKADGVIRWVAAKGKGVFDDSGRCVRVVGTAMDITARKEIESRLIELNETLERRVEERTAERDRAWKNSRDLQVVLDADGRVTAANEAWATILGYSPDDVIGRFYLDFVLPDDQESSLSAFAIARTGTLPPHISRYRHRDGSSRFISWVAAPEGGLVYANGRDVSDEWARQAELVSAEAARRESDALYRAYFENSPEALFVIRVESDGGFFVEQINPAHEAGVGFKLSEVRGRRIEDFLPPAAAEAVLRRYREVLSTDGIVQYRETFELRGEQQHWDTSLVPVREADGRIGRIIGSSRNITPQVTAEERLRQAQKMEAVGQLTGGIAHDFNNLLGAVVSGFDLIRRRPDEPGRVLRIAESGLAAAERGAKLTAQLLAFSRSQKIDIRPLLVSALVEGMRDLLGHTLGPQVRVRFELDGRPVAVLSDPVQLEMAVLNLAINARDAMPGGGELVIRTSVVNLVADPELPEGPYVELAVADNGVGMPPEVAARAFDPFFTTKEIGQGTGLGLSQVYGIARQAGGSARIHTVPGAGTTVLLLLPTTEDEVSAPQGPQPQELQIVETYSVLVIDDDEDVRRMLCEVLDVLGYRVFEAPDGPSGLAQFARTNPDIVILDYAMPGMNGAKVADAIRTTDPDAPIVFASGYSDTAAIEAVTGTPVPLLRKPFMIDELQAVLSTMLKRKD